MGARPLLDKYMILGPASGALVCQVLAGLSLAVATVLGSPSGGDALGLAFLAWAAGLCLLALAVVTATVVPLRPIERRLVVAVTIAMAAVALAALFVTGPRFMPPESP
jgi:hypothetical protein